MRVINEKNCDQSSSSGYQIYKKYEQETLLLKQQNY